MYNNLKKEIGNATIVAATKYVDVDRMLALLDEGICHFGENRVNDFLKKYEMLGENKNITWHFIGSLQTNKVKQMINKIGYLHSLNSYKLAECINKYRISPLKCFIEVNLNSGTNKHGIDKKDVLGLLDEIKNLSKIEVIGLMTMTEANQTDEEKLEVFKKLKEFKYELNELGYHNIKELSMGMSDDYKLAITMEASFVRLGRILFSEVE